MTSMVTFEVSHRPDTGTGQEGLSAAGVGVWGGGQPFLWLTDVCSQVHIECVTFAQVRVSVCVCVPTGYQPMPDVLVPRIPTRLPLSVGTTWIFSSN